MDAETLAAVRIEVESIANTVGTFVTGLDPALIPVVILGKAVAKMAPDIINDIENLVASIKGGTAPTGAENESLAIKIASLKNPAAL
jgi:hypothetical protein